MTLRTLNYGNDGILLIMRNAGFISSAAVSCSTLQVVQDFANRQHDSLVNAEVQQVCADDDATHTYIRTYVQTDRQTDRQTDEQKDRQTDGRTGGRTNKQTYIVAHTEYIHMYIYIYICYPPPQLSTFFVAFQGTRGNMFPKLGVMFSC